MNKQSGRFIAIILSLVMIVSCMSNSAFFTMADSIMETTELYSGDTTSQNIKDTETGIIGTSENMTEQSTSEGASTENDMTIDSNSTAETESGRNESETNNAPVSNKTMLSPVAAMSIVPAIGRHEAEASDYGSNTVQSGDYYTDMSGGSAVSIGPKWASESFQYISQQVTVGTSGKYKLTVAYAVPKQVELMVKVDEGEWQLFSEADSTTKVLPATDAWNKTRTATLEIPLLEGDHTISISGPIVDWDANYQAVYGGDWANTVSANIDYFDLAYIDAAPVEGKHEAENANSYTGGSAGAYTIVEDSAFSGGKAVGNMNTWPDDGRAYSTYFLNVARPGKYKLTIAYAADNDNENKKDFNIDVRINSTDDNAWQSVVTPLTGSHNTVKTISTTVDLTRGVNVIDVTGAVNVWYGEPHNWQWANIDYIQFSEAPIADGGKFEAEEAKSYTKGSASNDHTIPEGSGYSNGKGVGEMNAKASDGRAYLTYPVYAEYAGEYEITIGYAGGESTSDINMDVSVNGTSDSDWKTLTVPKTNDWNWIERTTTTVLLKKGLNNINITGASYHNDNQIGQWINIDYFSMKRIKDETNIALDKPVKTSGNRSDLEGSQYGSNSPEEAVDGYANSRWGGLADQAENWFQIDLQGMYEIESVKLLFEQAYPKSFQIQISRDGKNWIDVRNVKDWTPSETVESNAKLKWESSGKCLGKASHIRIYAKADDLNNKDWGLSIWEFEVRGQKVDSALSDVTLNKKAYANSIENGNIVESAIDGKISTRWASNNNEANPWHEVNLGKEYELYSVDFMFERAYAKKFRVQVSDDGNTWRDAYVEDNWTEPGTDCENIPSDKILGYSLHLDKVKASYVRFYVDERANSKWGVSLYEFEVWGKDLSVNDYWQNKNGKSYGVYPVDGLYDSEQDSKLNSSLVQGDVIGNNDTYEVPYEPDKQIYFYVNPYNIYITHGTDTICWSYSDNGWGASHNDTVISYSGQQQATVRYTMPNQDTFNSLLNEQKDENGGEYITTEIGVQIYGTTDGTSDLESGKEPKFQLKFKIKIMKPGSVAIEDTIEEDGSIRVKNAESGAKYEWQRSSDTKTWNSVAEKRDDLTVLYDNGKTLNVAMDIGGGMYYRVRKQGTESWSLPYYVPYYNNVQNGDFEHPAMNTPAVSNASQFPFGTIEGDEQQYPNGYAGMVWKTTGPGWKNSRGDKVGHDIEIVNGRRLRTDAEAAQVDQFSVTLEDMYKDNTHGNQFAELNCENIGALYQNILTTPNSECYWEMDHAGRWNQNTMYVVAMSAKDAKNYTTPEQLESIIQKAKDNNITTETKSDFYEGDEIDLGNGIKATIWKVISPARAGEWEHHSGKYKVPTGTQNYLTRFFFISAEGGRRKRGDTENRTVGNLLDNVSFEMKKSYSISYVVSGETKHTETGVVEPYGKVSVPSSISEVDLSKYTLYKAEMNGESYYFDEISRMMTVAYNHDDLVLYYRDSTIAVTKKIEGLDIVPSDYNITFELKRKDGSILETKTFSGDKFSKVDKVNESDPDSYFVTADFNGTDHGLADGEECVITEIISPKSNNNYLYQAKTDSATNTLSIDDIRKSEVRYSHEFTYHTQSANSFTFTNIYKPLRTITITKNVTGKFGSRTKPFDFTLALNSKAVSWTGGNVTENGTNYSFSLKNNESASFTVVDGCVATASESNYSSEGYITTWNNEINNKEVKSDITSVCTNASDSTITGLSNESKNFIILICCAIAALACYMAGRKGLFRRIMKKK